EELIASEASARAAIEETAEVREESQAKAREKYNLPGADGSEDAQSDDYRLSSQ
ncbi:MAG: hypothetical protein IT326_02375, partial [Anaerolineae bacterium]|nr:hypothetical protein [Anaerolineae bacterium]